MYLITIHSAIFSAFFYLRAFARGGFGLEAFYSLKKHNGWRVDGAIFRLVPNHFFIVKYIWTIPTIIKKNPKLSYVIYFQFMINDRLYNIILCVNNSAQHCTPYSIAWFRHDHACFRRVRGKIG